MKFLPLGFLLFCASIAEAQTPSAPPIAEMQKWVATLDATWQETYAKEVTAPFDAEMAKLAQQYLAALDSNSQKASTTGNLDQTVLWRAERDRFALAKDVPAEDEATAPVALKQLRVSWRTQAARLRSDRATRAKAVLARYDAVLADAQKKLTQAQRIDEALLLKKQREDVAARWTPAPVAVAIATPAAPKPAATTTAGSGAATSGPKAPPVAPREVLGKLLAAGAEVEIGVYRDRKEVRKASDAPEKFPYYSIHWHPRKDGVAVTDDDLAPLENIESLNLLGLHDLEITDAALSHVRALLALPKLHLDNLPKITGAGLKVVSELPRLDTLTLTNMPEPEVAIKAAVANKRLLNLRLGAMPISEAALSTICTLPTMETLDLLSGITGLTPAGLASLVKMRRLSSLYFEDFPVDDAMAAELGKIDSLQHLSIRNSKLTETGAISLGKLRNATTLTLWNPPVTPAALAAYKRMRALKSITVGKQTLPESTDKLKAALKGVEVRL